MGSALPEFAIEQTFKLNLNNNRNKRHKEFDKQCDEGKYTGKILKKIETENYIVSTTQYLKTNCENRLHFHKNPHISFLFQGVDIESRENNDSYTRKAGEIFFYDAEEPHRTVETIDDSKNLNIEFKQSGTLKIYAQNPIQQELFNNNPNNNLLALQILRELQLNDDFTQLSLETLCVGFLKRSNQKHSDFEPNWALVIKDFLNSTWQSKHTLFELSQVANVHPVTISKNFNRYFLCSYGEYVRKLKVSRAIPMIKNSELSLTEISYLCGFSDQSHFTRTFKMLTGLLPKQYQKL